MHNEMTIELDNRALWCTNTVVLTCTKYLCTIVHNVWLSGVCLQCRICEQVELADSVTLHHDNLRSLAQDLDDFQV